MKNSVKIFGLVFIVIMSACQKEEFLTDEKQERTKSNLKFDTKTRTIKTLIAKDWSKVANLKPRHSHTSVVFDDKMWIIGGKGVSDIPKNDVLYSIDGTHWKTATAKAPFKGRFHHTTTVFKGKMWVVGGLAYDPDKNDNEFYGNSEQQLSESVFHNHFLFTNGYSALNDIWSSTDGINWKKVSDKAEFSPRFSHSVTAFNGALWLFGGRSDHFGNTTGPENRYHNDIWRSYDGEHWTKVANETSWYILSRHTAMVFDEKFWLLGDDFQASDAIYSSKDGKEWQIVDYPTPLGGSLFHQVLTTDEKYLWCFGFDIASQTGSGMWHSDDGLNWTRATLNQPFKNRVAHTSVFFKDKLWMINGWWKSDSSIKAGNGFQGQVLSDIWSFEELGPEPIEDITSKTN